MAKEGLKHTPLYDEHKDLGARLVDFAGYEMPVQYSGIKAEHDAVRNHAGLFDVSHMGEAVFRGPDAEAAVQRGRVTPGVRTKFQAVALLVRQQHARVLAEEGSPTHRAEQLKRLDGIATILAKTAALNAVIWSIN